MKLNCSTISIIAVCCAVCMETGYMNWILQVWLYISLPQLHVYAPHSPLLNSQYLQRNAATSAGSHFILTLDPLNKICLHRDNNKLFKKMSLYYFFWGGGGVFLHQNTEDMARWFPPSSLLKEYCHWPLLCDMSCRICIAYFTRHVNSIL
jgi:hypothetical protein